MSFRFALIVTGLFLASCASLPPAAPVIAREEAAAPPISNVRLGQITSWWGDGRAPTALVNAGFVAVAPGTGGAGRSRLFGSDRATPACGRPQRHRRRRPGS